MTNVANKAFTWILLLLSALCSRGCDSVQDTIGTDGGVLELSDIALVTFPPGAFAEDVLVRVSQTNDDAVDERWEEEISKYAAVGRVDTEVRINTDSVQPLLDVTVDLLIPANFKETLTPDDEIRVFAQNVFDDPDGGETPFPTILLQLPRVAIDADVITVNLPSYAFSELATSDGTFEAVVFIGATPTARTASAALAAMIQPVPDPEFSPEVSESTHLTSSNYSANPRVSASAMTNGCDGASLRKPFDGDFPVTSPWGERTHPITGNKKFHAGADFAMPVGTPIKAAADGKILQIRNDPDGYGNYVDVQHSDGSVTRYAHLSDTSGIAVDQAVSAGDNIALSGNTGASTGPHLHLEYRPNGQLYDKDSTVDPVPCLDPIVTGSITVRDNGSLADDAFSVAINGITVCTTQIGASNTCGIGNLRPGTATLTITVIIAPDDVGTYEITLGDGLTFDDGSTSKSGSPPEGTSVDYGIIIPDPSTLTSADATAPVTGTTSSQKKSPISRRRR